MPMGAHRYLSIEPSRKDTIVWQPDKDLDLNGYPEYALAHSHALIPCARWELKKALQLLRDSNISIIEWLRAPSLVVSDTLFVPAARALAGKLSL